jgi:ubiquinone/menaquinone biosynthesis C-methylase UbiE
MLTEQDHDALRYMAFCADRLVDRLRLRPGEKVLDVATGGGMVATAAAQSVRPGGRVFAVDGSESSLEQLGAKTRHLGLDNIDLHAMSPQALEFRSAYFDAVVCSYGLVLADDMGAALQGWVRVLKPGGRLGFSTYAAGAFQPLLDRLLRLVADRGGRLDDAVLRRWRQLAEPETCERMLTLAGLVDIEVTEQSIGYHLSNSRDWLEIIGRSPPLKRLLSLLPAADRDDLLERHLGEVDTLAGADGLWLDVSTLFALGRRS